MAVQANIPSIVEQEILESIAVSALFKVLYSRLQILHEKVDRQGLILEALASSQRIGIMMEADLTPITRGGLRPIDVTPYKKNSSLPPSRQSDGQ